MIGMTMPKYEVRGPDPDGDWFVVRVEDGEEFAIDEVFATEAAATAGAARLFSLTADMTADHVAGSL